jgi:hypothetical protein
LPSLPQHSNQGCEFCQCTVTHPLGQKTISKLLPQESQQEFANQLEKEKSSTHKSLQSLLHLTQEFHWGPSYECGRLLPGLGQRKRKVSPSPIPRPPVKGSKWQKPMRFLLFRNSIQVIIKQDFPHIFHN